ncbi:MAG: response regulator, partial [Deltaproteobacteria bacterium]|nr:response regulator [Deltaproteobacteria bacterium]
MLLDASGRVVHVNQAWRRFARDNGGGDALEHGVGLDYLAACQSDPSVRELTHALEGLLQGSLESFRYRYRCNAPSVLRRFELRATRLAGAEPGGAAVALWHHDVTELEMAEARLRVQRGVAAALAEGLPLLEVCTRLGQLVCDELEWECFELWSQDPDGKIRLLLTSADTKPGLEAFRAATRNMGFQLGEGLPGRVWRSREPEWIADFSDSARFPRAPAARACGLGCAFGIPLASGPEVFLMLACFARGQRARDTATVELLQGIGAQLADVERRQRAEEKARVAERELASSHERLDEVLKSAPGFVVKTDLAGLVRYINRSRTVPREQTLGLHWTWLIPAEQRPALEGLFAEVIGSGETREYQVELSDAEGKPQHYHGRIGPLRLRDEAGEPRTAGAVIVAQDVTELRRLQSELDASQRLASVGALAAGVAHEVNNALSPVLANLTMITSALTQGSPERAFEDELLSMLHDAHDSAERIRDVVGDLKLLSRPKDEARGPVEVVPVLEGMLRLATTEIRHRARIVRTYAEVPPVLGAEGRLGQVLLNLLLNAAQAIPEGHAERNLIRVATKLLSDGEVAIEVSDSGGGIPPEVMRRLFTPFFTTKAEKGTGLGLSICDKIVRSMGGRIEVVSEVGVGSTFRVVLAVAAPELATLPVEPRPASLDGPRGRVLVVDDERAVGLAMRRALSGAHEVVFANSGREAIALFERGERFEVILCDVMMPEMSGPELIDLLKRRWPEVAEGVVVVTGGALSPS